MILTRARYPYNYGIFLPPHDKHISFYSCPRTYALALTFETSDANLFLRDYDFCLDKNNNTTYAHPIAYSATIAATITPFAIATTLVIATSQITQAIADKGAIATALVMGNSQIVQASNVGSGIATASIEASLQLSENDAREIVREEVFLTNTQQIAQLATALNKPLFLNSLFGTIAQATHKTQIQGSQFIIKTHDDANNLFVRNLVFDDSLQPMKEVD